MFKYRTMEETLILPGLTNFLVREKNPISYLVNDGRKDYSREKARLELYMDLVNRYGYPMETISFDVNSIKIGEKVDMVIYTDGRKKDVYALVSFLDVKTSEVDFKLNLWQMVKKAKKLKAIYVATVTEKKREVIDISLFDGKSLKKAMIRDFPKRV